MAPTVQPNHAHIALSVPPSSVCEMREMERAYGERVTIEIMTPPDRLMPGRYPGDGDQVTRARWVLNVAAVSPVVRSS